ncbi:hypothetical protein GCM10025867_49690 (plasmid) [Frondihabitans sucicola]|uniref:Minor tail protein n=1 Tax=Frondihabitans sucicola TaxID=1268041 RepID=A0ABM8GW75_9MICO|nr:hypothetical protein [Frondihabitans sucicola]BDZ52728.1 hypothetical protein GCM10025867_49690 [Frondihabitans sucicola]
MSTRTYIGQADMKTATWNAVYVHMDGNPLSILPTLGAFLARTGSVDGVMGLLTTGGATHWSSINHEQIDPADYFPVKPEWAKAPFRSNERRAWNWFQYQDGTSEIAVGGVGVNFHVDGIEAPSGTLHEGRTESENAPSDAEWAYIFTSTELVILMPKAFMEENTMIEVDRVPLADLATLSPERMAEINYGPEFERTNPYAWAIDSTVPEGSRNLTARTWLGLDPLTPDDATGLRYGKSGMFYKFTGSSTSDGRTRTVTTETADGRRVDIKLPLVDWSLKSAPKGAEFVYPATKFDMVVA